MDKRTKVKTRSHTPPSLANARVSGGVVVKANLNAFFLLFLSLNRILDLRS